MKSKLALKTLILSSTIFLSLTSFSSAFAQRTSRLVKTPQITRTNTVPTAKPVPETKLTQATPQQTVIYVNPQTGSDSSATATSDSTPYRTISYALQRATPGTTIQLASGRYTSETFPLTLKAGVTLKGNESGQGQGVEIVGGDSYMSRTFARQNVTIVAQENAQILGVTVTNPNSRGTGIWIESGQAVIRNNTFINSKREGIFVTGNAAPRIENNRFTNNDANGISVAKEAKGEIRNNVFDNTGFGIAIGGTSTPIVSDNQIRGNRNGIVLTDSAHPRLISNFIEDNRDYGLVIMGQSEPNLDRNTFKGNQKQDQFRVSPLPQQAPPDDATSK
jgi:parallel beta-helix repeat protein